MEEKNIRKRENYIDIAKTIGIILVVLGHTEFVGKNFIYQFHLPLFFFLSGVVFNIERTKDPKKFLCRRIISLYLPFVVFEVLFLIFHNFFSYINFYTNLSHVQLTYSAKDMLINILKIITLGGGEELAGPLWFLISTFEINIIFAILARISQKYEKKFPIFLLIICTILFFMGCYTDLPRMLSQSLIGMFFYCCGYIFKKYSSKVNFSIIGILISLLIVATCTVFNTVDISQLDITYKLLLIVSGLAGCYMVLGFSKKIKLLENKFFLYCGRNTIYILALHCLFFKFVMFLEILIYNKDIKLLGMFPVYQYSQWWSILLTIIGVLGPIVIKYLVDIIKSKISRENNKEHMQCKQGQ